jgi:ankyrin repeat protein
MWDDPIKGMLKSTELHEAVAEDDIDRVRRLLDAGADVNARAWHGFTPLMVACGSPMTEIHRAIKKIRATAPRPPDFKDLLKAGDLLANFPRIDQAQIDARIAQMRAKEETPPPDDPAIPLLLLQRGADVNAIAEDGQCALMIAVSAGRTTTARGLLEHGADLRAQTKDNETALMLAAKSRRQEAVELLLERGADPDYRTPQGVTTLMAAAEGGCVEVARLLLARGQDVNTASVNGGTALLRAAVRGNDEMVTFLKEQGAHVGFLEAVALGDLELAASLPTPSEAERPPRWGEAVLYRVVKQGRADAIHLLAARGVNTGAAGNMGQSALMPAVMRGDLAAVRALLDRGADPNGATGATTGHRMVPLSWAARAGHNEIVDLLVERGADPDRGDTLGFTPLSGAVMAGKVETARRLLAAGADPNGSLNGGMSLLAFAVTRDDKEMVRLLLDQGAQVQGDSEIAPMAKILAREKPEIGAMLKAATGVVLHDLAKEGKTAELLAQLDAGADIEARGDHDETPLIAAVMGKQLETARALIERGADINAVTRIGATALVCAAVRGDVETTRLLIEHGADVTATDPAGHTPLTWVALADKAATAALLIEAGARVGPVEAAILGDLSTLRWLLDGGAEVDTRDANGLTPLMGAAARGHLEIIEVLLIRRAEIDATDEEGRTALTWAATHKQLEAVRLLLDRGADVNAAGEDRHHARFMEEQIRREHPMVSNLTRTILDAPLTEAQMRVQDELDTNSAASDRRQTDVGEDLLGRYVAGQESLVRETLQRRGTTPLGAAALHDDTQVAELLLDHGADVNAPGAFAGHTSIAAAAMTGKGAMVRLLLARGADPTIGDWIGQTALSLAERFGKNPEVVEMLKAALKARAETV